MLLGNIGSHALVPHLYAKPPYNAFTDLETAVLDRHAAQPAGCHPDFPHDTLAKLIAAAKAEPGKYQYGGSGIGTSPTLAMELFKQKTGADLTLISYRGASAADGRRAGGPPAAVRRQHRFADGPGERRQAEAVASTGAQRSPVTPDTPTFAEAGFPTSSSPRGRCGRCRPGTPAKVKEKLQARAPRRR